MPSITRVRVRYKDTDTMSAQRVPREFRSDAELLATLLGYSRSDALTRQPETAVCPSLSDNLVTPRSDPNLDAIAHEQAVRPAASQRAEVDLDEVRAPAVRKQDAHSVAGDRGVTRDSSPRRIQ